MGTSTANTGGMGDACAVCGAHHRHVYGHVGNDKMPMKFSDREQVVCMAVCGVSNHGPAAFVVSPSVSPSVSPPVLVVA